MCIFDSIISPINLLENLHILILLSIQIEWHKTFQIIFVKRLTFFSVLYIESRTLCMCPTTKISSQFSKWLIWKIHNNFILSIGAINIKTLFWGGKKDFYLMEFTITKYQRLDGLSNTNTFFLVLKSRHVKSMCWLLKNFIFPRLMWSLLNVYIWVYIPTS